MRVSLQELRELIRTTLETIDRRMTWIELMRVYPGPALVIREHLKECGPEDPSLDPEHARSCDPANMIFVEKMASLSAPAMKTKPGECLHSGIFRKAIALEIQRKMKLNKSMLPAFLTAGLIGSMNENSTG